MINYNFSNSEFSFDLKKESDQKELIELILVNFRNNFPFFINLLVSICDIKNVEEDKKSSLAYTKLNKKSERIDIFINFDLIEEKKMTYYEIIFLIFHELLHNYLYHFTTFEQEIKEGNIHLVNIVTDYFVNELCYELLNNYKENIKFKEKELEIINYKTIDEICDKNNIKNLPTNSVLRGKWDEKDLYNFLSKNLPKENIASSYDFDKNIDNHEESFGEDENNVSDSKISNNTLKEIIKNKIKIIEKEMESYGFTEKEASLINRKRELLKPIFFLNELKLKRIINKSMSKHLEKTYKRTSRKKQFDDFIMKGKIKKNGFKLVIAIDVSGSISDDDLNKFLSMIYGLEKKNKECLFDVLFWSSTKIIDNEHSFKNISNVKSFFEKVKINSSGGTDISTLHEYLNENYKEQIELINITDGFFNYNKNLNNNIVKYHFVLTSQIREDFLSFYKEGRFNILTILDKKEI